MRYQIFYITLHYIIICNATINELIFPEVPEKDCENLPLYFFHGAFAPSFIWCRCLCQQLLFGVQQGSVLGSLLYAALNTAEIRHVIAYSTVCVSIVQRHQCLEWMSDSRLKLNPAKTEVT